MPAKNTIRIGCFDSAGFPDIQSLNVSHFILRCLRAECIRYEAGPKMIWKSSGAARISRFTAAGEGGEGVGMARSARAPLSRSGYAIDATLGLSHGRRTLRAHVVGRVLGRYGLRLRARRLSSIRSERHLARQRIIAASRPTV
jgi:hypothetical protein